MLRPCGQRSLVCNFSLEFKDNRKGNVSCAVRKEQICALTPFFSFLHLFLFSYEVGMYMFIDFEFVRESRSMMHVMYSWNVFINSSQFIKANVYGI